MKLYGSSTEQTERQSAKLYEKLQVLVLANDVDNALVQLGDQENLSCQFTGNLDEYNNSQVVIFKSVILRHKLPLYRPPGQLWIYNVWESARNTPETFYKENVDAIKRFNYTMTYSLTSDLYFPYGECTEYQLHPAIISQQIDDIVNRKTHMISWMVSHCHTPSLREDYVRELTKHIHVDVYGKCGSLQCSTQDECFRTLSKYKFYLAFENSLCGEYMTEKLWRSFDLGLVPVVYGALEAYKSVLPPNSYIDVADFATPKLLADYLLMLDTNTSLFRSYFLWKYKYNCGHIPRFRKGMKVCDFIHRRKDDKNHQANIKEIWKAYSTRCLNSVAYLEKHGVFNHTQNGLNANHFMD